MQHSAAQHKATSPGVSSTRGDQGQVASHTSQCLVCGRANRSAGQNCRLGDCLDAPLRLPVLPRVLTFRLPLARVFVDLCYILRPLHTLHVTTALSAACVNEVCVQGLSASGCCGTRRTFFLRLGTRRSVTASDMVGWCAAVVAEELGGWCCCWCCCCWGGASTSVPAPAATCAAAIVLLQLAHSDSIPWRCCCCERTLAPAACLSSLLLLLLLEPAAEGASQDVGHPQSSTQVGG